MTSLTKSQIDKLYTMIDFEEYEEIISAKVDFTTGKCIIVIEDHEDGVTFPYMGKLDKERLNILNGE